MQDSTLTAGQTQKQQRLPEIKKEAGLDKAVMIKIRTNSLHMDEAKEKRDKGNYGNGNITAEYQQTRRESRDKQND